MGKRIEELTVVISSCAQLKVLSGASYTLSRTAAHRYNSIERIAKEEEEGKRSAREPMGA